MEFRISKLIGKIILVYSGHIDWGNNICVSSKGLLVWSVDTEKNRKIGDWVELNEVHYLHHVQYEETPMQAEDDNV